MKKNIFSKIASIIMTICLTITCFPLTPVFAMEKSSNNITSASIDVDSAITRSGTEEFPYAGEEHYVGTIYNFSNNVTPTKTAPTDSRTHRMIFRIEFLKSSIDQGVGDVQLMVYIKRSNGYEQCITALNTDNITGSTSNVISFRTDWFNVSPGEQFQIEFDVISKNSSTSNGNLRYGTASYWVYSD